MRIFVAISNNILYTIPNRIAVVGAVPAADALSPAARHQRSARHILPACRKAYLVLFNFDYKRKLIIAYTHIKIGLREDILSGFVKEMFPAMIF